MSTKCTTVPPPPVGLKQHMVMVEGLAVFQTAGGFYLHMGYKAAIFLQNYSISTHLLLYANFANMMGGFFSQCATEGVSQDSHL